MRAESALSLYITWPSWLGIGLSLKEGLVECSTVCVKSEVILIYILRKNTFRLFAPPHKRFGFFQYFSSLNVNKIYTPPPSVYVIWSPRKVNISWGQWNLMKTNAPLITKIAFQFFLTFSVLLDKMSKTIQWKVLIKFRWPDEKFRCHASSIKVHIFWEGHKILQNLPLTFDYSTYRRK